MSALLGLMAYCIWKSYKLKLKSQDIFALFSRQKNCFFLDSGLGKSSNGRYSFLGIEPFLTLKDNSASIFDQLRRNLNIYKISAKASPLLFSGGAVGYLAYDLGFGLEPKLKKISKPQPNIPAAFFGFYNCGVAIDHASKRLYIFSVGFPETKSGPAEKLCAANFQKIYQLLCQVKPVKNHVFPQIKPKIKLSSNFTKPQYLKAVLKAKDYVKKGDIYQLNLTQQFKGRTDLSPEEIYLALRKASPSDFSVYFDAGDFQIISSSPERFLKLENNQVWTYPMKGTRPRGVGHQADKQLLSQLYSSAKDKAELMMIVDLERNDLGRVCDYASIRVPTLRQIEKYSTVYQAIAKICGRLAKGKDRIDLLKACFPGGSITGCPKIRAMEIIEELEPGRRSIYTGSLGYLGFSGNLDFNILIRTILKEKDKISFGVGGGIVADSQPEEEYKETLIKAEGIFRALAMR